MLLAQEPQLLLVDEPVAGMTDAETEQTAELLREINRTRSVVVVEHDMEFVRALDVQGDGAARRLGAVGRLDRPRQRRSARDRGLSGALSMLKSSTSICTTAQPSRCGRCRSTAEVGAVTCLLGPQRRGQDQPAARDHGRASDQRRRDPLGGRGHHAAADRRPGAARHRLGAAGPRDLSAADGAGEPGDRLRACCRAASVACRTRSSSCSRC